jgi:hypothetical protein
MEITFVSATLLIMKMMHLGKVKTGQESDQYRNQRLESHAGQM